MTIVLLNIIIIVGLRDRKQVHYNYLLFFFFTMYNDNWIYMNDVPEPLSASSFT